MPKGNPRQIALALRRRALTLEAAVRESEKQAAEEGLKIARFLSSGLYTLERLARLGHPYATRSPDPPADPAVINSHTGVFFRGWKIRGPRKSGGTLTTRLVNDSPVAKFLLAGTSRMIPRPILKAIRMKLKGKRQKLLTAALKRSRPS